MRRRGPIDIFGYLDYRKFLEDYYQSRKPRGFSYRVFSRHADVSSPNYLKLIIQGKRNLTAQMAARFAQACNLEGEPAEYFVNLVAFNQAKSSVERDKIYTKLKTFRRYRSAQRLELAHAAYCSNWYLPAIREMAAREDFRDDPKWIAKQLWPPIKPNQAASALNQLLKLKLLERDANGRVSQKNAFVSTGPETEHLLVAKYHRAMMARAAESIDLVPASERDISSLTFCVKKNGIGEIKRRIQAFRQELIALAEAQEAPHQVIQVNFQLFPLSRDLDDQGETL
jgi:uncharacterized protein (TIGR02147 family)